MMYKVEIKWDFRSPTLGVLTGDVQIGNISMGKLSEHDATSFKVKKERNSLVYTGAPKIIQRCKPLIDVMVYAYYEGMLMSPESVAWFKNCSRHNNDVHMTLLD